MLNQLKFSSGGGGQVFRRANKGGIFNVFLDGLSGALKDVWDCVLEDVWHGVLAVEKAGELFWELKIIKNLPPHLSWINEFTKMNSFLFWPLSELGAGV